MPEIDHQDTDLTDPHGEAEMLRAERDALRAENERLREALGKLHHAVCGETGFAECVRAHSGLSYPWPALDEADELVIAFFRESRHD